MATEAPFADNEYLDRYQRAQALMERDGLDALVVSEKNNYWYFSGLISYQLDHIQRPQICILPKSGKPLLLVYGNDKAKAKALPWVGDVRAYTDVPSAAIEARHDPARSRGPALHLDDRRRRAPAPSGFSHAQLVDPLR